MLNEIRNRFKNFHQRTIPPHILQQVHAELLEESTFDVVYLILIIGSCAIATFGLLSNSSAVIIGAMIVAPLMLPIRGIAFGALIGDVWLFEKGIVAVFWGTLLAITIACGLGLLTGIPDYGNEVLSRSQPTLLDLGIAVAAGGISGYAKVEPRISGSLAGTAIAVALMPPVCVIGLGLSQGYWSLSLGAILLYLTNLLGITLACMMTFLLSGYSPTSRARPVLAWTLALTSLLLIPLGISFTQLVRQSQLEAAINKALLNRTVTFQRINLLKSNVNWLTTPPEIRLSVRSREPVTPKQVRLLETFLEREMKQPFTLIFEVGQVEEVRAGKSN